MSASVREPDHDGSSKDDPSKYAPKKVRPAEPDPAPAGAPPEGSAAPKGGGAEPAAEPPPWRRSSRQRGSGGTAFVGDVAIAELRTKLALAPDRLPEPPPASSRRSKLAWTGRLTGIAIVLAVGFIGYRWGSSPASRFQLPHPSSHARTPVAPDQPVTATAQDPGATVLNAVPAIYPPPAKAIPSNGKTFRQLTVGVVPAQQADDVVRLAISAADAGVNATVVIGGLAAGSALSAGKEVAPKTWRLSVEDLPGVSVTPPLGFVGIMDLTVELRLADNSVTDRKGLQLEWVGRGVTKWQPRQHDAAEIAQMLKKGDELMANGDVAAARLMYQRAAEAGEAAAAFALAETYDPLVLAKGGIPPNAGLAQAWYRKARDLGSTQAPERLERLAKLPDQ